MTISTPALQADEYLRIALEAVRQKDHRQAIVCLKEGVLAYQEDARLIYLLGAEYAQIGMPEQADELMAKALTLNPSMHAARFQLGLLRMTAGKPDSARETWKEFDVLPKEHAFRLFRDALEALACDDLSQALAMLEQGILANDFSVDLNQDMVALAQRIRETISPVEPEINTAAASSHVLLHGYRKSE